MIVKVSEGLIIELEKSELAIVAAADLRLLFPSMVIVRRSNWMVNGNDMI